MISEQEIERLTEMLVKRIEQANVLFLEKIGESVKELGTLTPTKAQQLIQILKYGGKYQEIVREIAKLMNMNVKDVEQIFYEFAKKDQNFAKNFYKFKGKEFIPIEKNKILREQVKALAKITQGEMINFSRTRAIGYSIRDAKGRIQLMGLKEAYNKVLDEAILNVGQGKETFDSAMYRILKEIGGSGLKTLDFESGRSVRLDSMIRQNMQGALRNLHNELQQQFGEEFESDGVEISVHLNPAPDHALVQGKQFTKKEFYKFQHDQDSKSYDGMFFPAESVETGHDRRSIGEYNCYHYIFSIVLGVSKPNYTNAQLQEIIDKNEKGFEIDGKHYSNYEGQQMQRKLESQIRKYKDLQILGKASGNQDLINESQMKINQLTTKYNEFCKKSGLSRKADRLRVSGYRKTSLPNNSKEIEYARNNNTIWHSTENLKEIIETNKIISPSIAVAKELNTKVKYGTQFIEFKPEILENVDKKTILYKGDGGNIYLQNKNKFDNLINVLKNTPKYYNEIKLQNNIDFEKYVKKIYIRNDENKEIIKFLKDNNIEFEIYKSDKGEMPKRKNR